MAFQIDLPKPIRREIDRSPGNMRQRLKKAVDDLANNQHPPGSKQLRDSTNRYRLRLDDWRIIYRIDEARQIVTILAVRRKEGPETYLGLE